MTYPAVISRGLRFEGGALGGPLPTRRAARVDARAISFAAMFLTIAAAPGCELPPEPSPVLPGEDAGAAVSALSALPVGPDAPLPCRFSLIGSEPPTLAIHALGSRWVVDGVDGPEVCPGRGFWMEGAVLSLCPGSCAVVAEDTDSRVVPYDLL